MVVALDMLPINQFCKSGIGNHMRQFVKTMLERYPDNRYVCLNWSNTRLSKEELGIEEEYLAGVSNYDVSIEHIITDFIAKYDPDVYIDFSSTSGRRPGLKKGWFGKTKLVGISHDIMMHTIRWECMYDTYVYRQYLDAIVNLRGYDRIFSVSQTTADDLKTNLKINSSLIDVIYESSGHDKTKVGSDTVEQIKRKYSLCSEYYLVPSADMPHKNIDRTVMAYIKTCEKYHNMPKLVITGVIKERTLSHIRRLETGHGIRDNIIFTGYVDKMDLEALYSGASWVIYLSTYEGFGMPIIEAWERDLPIMTSNATSTRELAKGYGVLVDPQNVEDITDGFVMLLKMDETERKKYIELGKKRLKDFSWIQSVDMFFEGIDKCFDENTITNEVFDTDKWINDQVLGLDSELGNAEGKHLPSAGDAAERDRRSYFLLNRWMQLNEKNISIENRLLKKGYRNIGIYGMGILADRLITALRHSPIRIVCGIDRTPWEMTDDFEIFHPLDEIPHMDVLIIALATEKELFEEYFEGRISCPIITIEEVIDWAGE